MVQQWNERIREFFQERRAKAKVTFQLIRKCPHTVVVPAVVLALLLAGGVCAVKYGLASNEDKARGDASWTGQVSAQTMQLDIQKAVLPLIQLEQVIKKQPRVSSVLAAWERFSEAIWQAAPPGAHSLLLIYQGVVEQNVAKNASQTYPKGTDVLAEKSPFRGLALAAIEARTPTMQGPLPVFGGQFLTFTFPIFIANATQNETWGLAREPTACPEGVCWNETTRTKYWGSVAMVVNMTSLVLESPSLLALRSGYTVRLERPAAGGAAAAAAAGEAGLRTGSGSGAGAGVAGDNMVAVDDGDGSPPPAGAVCEPIRMLDQEWELCLWRTWEPSYLKYMYVVVVVVGSVVIAGLVFTVLLAWVENRELLRSVLPKAAIQRIRADAEWARCVYAEDDFKAVKLETPAGHMLGIISTCLNGGLPDVVPLLAVRDALQRSADVYRPTAEMMDNQMQDSAYVDAEVRSMLVAQLIGERKRHEGTESGTEKFDARPRFSSMGGNSMIKLMATEQAQCLAGSGGSGAVSLSLAAASMDAASLEVRETMTEGDRPSSLIPAGGRSTESTAVTPRETAKGPESLQSVLQQLMSVGLGIKSTTGGAGSPHSPHSPHPYLSSPDSKKINLKLLIDPPSKGITTEVEAVLFTADSWSFDVYALDQATNGHPLSVLGYWLLQRTNLIQSTQMDGVKLARFLQHVEAGYSANHPYHNQRHAADVLQSMHVIIHRGGLVPGYVDRVTMLACYIAAMIHDYQHEGVTNDFHVNSHDDLAVLYNDRSPSENHHLAAAFSLLKAQQGELNCMSGLSKASWAKFRRLTIEMVLATDMKQHFAILGQFDALHVAEASGSSKTSSRVSLASDDLARHVRANNSGNPPVPPPFRSAGSGATLTLMPISDNDKVLSLQMALKCADLGHLAAPTEIHLRWVRDLEAELFAQGDAERAAGLKVSPLCDRGKEGVSKAQGAFFDFVVLPLFRTFTNRFKGASPLLQQVTVNQHHWMPHGVGGAASNKGSSTAASSRSASKGSMAGPTNL